MYLRTQEVFPFLRKPLSRIVHGLYYLPDVFFNQVYTDVWLKHANNTNKKLTEMLQALQEGFLP